MITFIVCMYVCTYVCMCDCRPTYVRMYFNFKAKEANKDHVLQKNDKMKS